MQRATRVLRKAAHAHGHGSHGDSSKYGGFHAPHVAPFHQHMATFIGATMWFWIFLRCKEDGGVLLGLHKPWEAHAHHEEEHHEEHHDDAAAHQELK